MGERTREGNLFFLLCWPAIRGENALPFLFSLKKSLRLGENSIKIKCVVDI